MADSPERCADPRVLDHDTWQTMSRVLLVDQNGVIQGSAGDCLRGSPDGALTVPENYGTFSVRVRLNDQCPIWEIVSFRLTVQGFNRFNVRMGDQMSGDVEVQLYH